MAKIKVVQDKEKPVPKETLAEAIVRIGDAAESLRRSGLNEDAIVVLLHDRSGIGKPAIRTVISSMRQLKAWYCR